MAIVGKIMQVMGIIIFFIFGGAFVVMLAGFGLMMTMVVAAYLFLRTYLIGDIE